MVAMAICRRAASASALLLPLLLAAEASHEGCGAGSSVAASASAVTAAAVVTSSLVGEADAVAVGEESGKALMRRSAASHSEALEEQEWEGLDEEDLEEDAEDQVMMPDSAALLDSPTGAGGRVARQRGAKRQSSLQVGSFEEQHVSSAEFKALVQRLKVEDAGELEGGPAREAANEAANEAASDEFASTTTTTTTGCFDREKDAAPIISMDGLSQSCPDLKHFCEGAGDKSIYVALKCPLTCFVCENVVIPDPTGIPRETHCFRRRRWGYCYSRRRRYN